MTVFRFSAITFTYNENTDRYSEIRSNNTLEVTGSYGASIRYTHVITQATDVLPDVYLMTNGVTRIATASGIVVSDEAATYLGRMTHSRGATDFLMMEDEIRPGVYRVTFARIGGAALPNLTTAAQIEQLIDTGAMTRIDSGSLASNRNIALTAIAASNSDDQTINGTSGANTYYGGIGEDVIKGLGGNDTLYGGAHDDTLYGGDGNDKLYGGTSQDKLYGGAGTDLLDGGSGLDSLYGGSGNDTLLGRDGNDRLLGGAGNDSLSGDDGNDTLYGEAGADRLNGGTGADYLSGGSENDTLYGGDGDDRLFGGTGGDVIYGEAGGDRVSGEDGNDRLYGGDGFDFVFGGSGNDTLYGGAHNDSLYGGSGNDTLYGGSGHDLMFGGGGNDLMAGGTGMEAFMFTRATSGANFGYDKIQGYQRGEVLNFNDYGLGSVSVTQVGTSVVIVAGAAGTVELLNFNIADFDHSALLY